MTVKDLYNICDQMTINTKCFIINSDRVVIAYNTRYMDLPVSATDFLIEHFRFMTDNEVIIWVA